MRPVLDPSQLSGCPRFALRVSTALLALSVCGCAPGIQQRPLPSVPPSQAFAPAPAPAPAPTLTPPATLPEVESDSASGSELAAPAPSDPPAAEPAPAPLEVELPFKLYERPRTEGKVYGAGRDEELARWNVGGTGDPEFISNRSGYHPGARVVIDVSVVGGRLPKRGSKVMSQAGLQAEARSKGYWPVRICFEEALRQDPKQHGKTRVRIGIARSGRVTSARLVESELDELGAGCLRDVLREFAFKRAMPHGSVAADVTIKLWPGDAPVVVYEAPNGVTVNNPGLLDPKASRQVLLDAGSSLESCYRQGLVTDPALWGRLQLLIEFDAKGRLARISESESRFPDPEVTRCIIDVVTGLALPPPRGGALLYNQGLRLGVPDFAKPADPEHSDVASEKPVAPPGASAGSD